MTIDGIERNLDKYNIINKDIGNISINNTKKNIKEEEDHKITELKKACSEFESLFINYIIKEMRATIPKTGMFSGGKAEEIYTSMMDIQLAKNIAEEGGFGLSRMLFEQFVKNDEVENPAKNDGIKY